MPILPTKPIDRHNGLNTVSNEEDIKDTEVTDSRNDDISAEGEVKTRPGMSRVSTTALSAMAWEIFGFVAEEETQTRIAITNDGVIQTW